MLETMYSKSYDHDFIRRKTKADYEFLKASNHREELGKSSLGCVKLARDIYTNKLVAIKIIPKKIFSKGNKSEFLKREIDIHSKIDHPHIIKLHDVFEDYANVYLVLEYAQNRTLFRLLKKYKRLKEEEAFVYFLQTCLGIDYLQKHKILHRDLKPENLLLDNGFNIKICDFGLSIEDQEQMNIICGTTDYMAPEMLKKINYDYRLDIWCLGVLLYEMLYGNTPFQGKNDNEKWANIIKNNSIVFDKTISSDAINLIKNLLKSSPSDRLSMDGIFKHAWMKKHEKILGIKISDYIYDIKSKDDLISKISRKEDLIQNGTSINNDLDSNVSSNRQSFERSLSLSNTNLAHDTSILKSRNGYDNSIENIDNALYGTTASDEIIPLISSNNCISSIPINNDSLVPQIQKDKLISEQQTLRHSINSISFLSTSSQINVEGRDTLNLETSHPCIPSTILLRFDNPYAKNYLDRKSNIQSNSESEFKKKIPEISPRNQEINFRKSIESRESNSEISFFDLILRQCGCFCKRKIKSKEDDQPCYELIKLKLSIRNKFFSNSNHIQ